MQIDTKKRDSFMEMMKEVAEGHNCTVTFDIRFNDIDYMKIIIAKNFHTFEYIIHWPRVKSQTQIATTIWAIFFDDYHSRDFATNEPHVDKNVIMTIKDVIFNDPATIVFWEDGTKTVVKCQEGDVFDPEKGLTMAISKKALGNKGNYCNEIKKWTEKYSESLYPNVAIDNTVSISFKDSKRFCDILEKRLNRILERRLNV